MGSAFVLFSPFRLIVFFLENYHKSNSIVDMPIRYINVVNKYKIDAQIYSFHFFQMLHMDLFILQIGCTSQSSEVQRLSGKIISDLQRYIKSLLNLLALCGIIDYFL